MQTFLLCFLGVGVLGANSSVQLPVHFEPAREGGFLVHVRSRNYSVTRDGSLTFGAGAAMQVVGADPAATARPFDLLSGKLNDLRGSDPSSWRTGIPLYGSLRVPNVYSGIDLIYHGREDQLEYDFEVSPGASPNRIVLDFHGAEAVTRAQGQGLTIVFKDQQFYLHPPDIVQGNRRVSGGYRLLGGTRIGFRVGRYDHRRSLLIDPVLSYVDFSRAQGLSPIHALATDPDGNIYIATATAGSGNCSPTPSKTFTACPAVLVAKLDPTGTRLLYSTSWGDDQSNVASSLAVDRSGNAYVSGTRRAASFSPPPDGVGFVFKINASGSLIYQRYIGGDTAANAVTVDSNGNAYVAGTSIGFDFPNVNPLPVQPTVKSLFVTNDAGRTWRNINNGIKTAVNRLAIDPSRPSTLFAAITLYAATSQGLYKSVNGGVSWTRLLPEAKSVRDVALDPQHPATVYATYVGDSAFDHLGRSTDGGATWTTISANFPSPPPSNRAFDRTLLAFAVDPSNPQVLWASVADLLTGTVIKSDDAGAHWRIVYIFPNDTKTTDTLSALFKFGEILIDPKNSSHLYLCCVSRASVPRIDIPVSLSAVAGVYRTENGGQSWIEGGAGPVSGITGIVSPVLDPGDSNTLWGSPAAAAVFRRARMLE